MSKTVKVQVVTGLYRQPGPRGDGTDDIVRRRGDIIDIDVEEFRQLPRSFKLYAEVEAERKAAERPASDPGFEKNREAARAAFDAQKKAAAITAEREAANARAIADDVRASADKTPAERKPQPAARAAAGR